MRIKRRHVLHGAAVVATLALLASPTPLPPVPADDAGVDAHVQAMATLFGRFVGPEGILMRVHGDAREPMSMAAVAAMVGHDLARMGAPVPDAEAATGPPPPVLAGDLALFEFWVGFYQERYPSDACADETFGPGTHGSAGRQNTGQAPYTHTGRAESALPIDRWIREATTTDLLTGAVYDHRGYRLNYVAQGSFACWIFEGFGNTFIVHYPTARGVFVYGPLCLEAQC